MTLQILEQMREALAYRYPQEIRQIRRFPRGYTYAVCPRCKISLDGEYMHFCSDCGQRLSWEHYEELTPVPFDGI